MIFLFTDFGFEGPYMGQMQAVLAMAAPGVSVITLMADAPQFRPHEAGHLLAALLEYCPVGSIIVGVVDPGVGGPRPAIAAQMGGRWLVGPGNGLFDPVARRLGVEQCHMVSAAPGSVVSASFHGRDLFAPAAARLAVMGACDGGECAYPFVSPVSGLTDHGDLAALIYLDRYGNGMTGLRAEKLSPLARLSVGGHVVRKARTFGDVSPGTAFWYENSCGLAEIAINQGNAAMALGLTVGQPIHVLEDPSAHFQD